MKRLILLLALILFLSACSPSAQEPPCPPESILYLGGAPILNKFEIEGGPGDPNGGASIVIRTPIKLEKEGFHLAIVGFTEDEKQDVLFTEADIAPMSYFVINEEQYRDYARLILFLDYTWNGTLMSQRIVDLLTGEEDSSVTKEFDIIEQTLPSEPTAPTSPAVPDISAYEALLSFSAEPNWLARALGCLFESPSEMDLYYMFYLGVDHPGSWNEISAESHQTLINEGFIEEMDLQIMPVAKLEEALQTTFSVGISDVTIPEEWCYIEAEDAYCSNHNDAFFPGVPIITAVEDDGHFITIHYTIEGYWIPDTEEILDSASLILCLERQDDGSVHAVFNVLAP